MFTRVRRNLQTLLKLLRACILHNSILVRTVGLHHCMVLFMDGVTRLWAERFTLYAPVRCHTVGRAVWEED